MSRVEGKTGYLFTTTGKSPVSGWSKIKRRLDTARLREWRLHDLRLTCATDMAIEAHVGLNALQRVNPAKVGTWSSGRYGKRQF